MDPMLLRPEEAAQALSISRTAVYELLRSRQLRSVQIGRSRRIAVTAIEEFIEAAAAAAGEVGEGN